MADDVRTGDLCPVDDIANEYVSERARLDPAVYGVQE